MKQGALIPPFSLVRAKDCFPQCPAKPDKGLPVSHLPRLVGSHLTGSATPAGCPLALTVVVCEG